MNPLSWFRALLRRSSAERDLQREVEFHLAMEREANERAGMSGPEAQRAAVVAFGGIDQAKEACRDVWALALIRSVVQDLIYAWKGLRRTLGFTGVVVCTLGLGIGASAAIFSLAERTLIFTENYPGDVYVVCTGEDTHSYGPQMHDYNLRVYEQAECIAESAKAAYQWGNVAVDGQPVATGWVGVSANLFTLVGIKPGQGRGFVPGEDREGANAVVVISDRVWRRVFNADPQILGRRIVMGSDVCSVVGVLKTEQRLPPTFSGDYLRPLVYRMNPDRPWEPILSMLVKLRTGFTVAQATEALNSAKIDIPKGMFMDGKVRVLLVSLPDFSKSVSRSEIFWILLAAVGFVYAIACLNSSNLMVSRMLGRRRELSIRLALGAGRWRIVRLLLAESLIVAGMGTLAGILIGNWLVPVLLRILANDAYDSHSSLWSFAWFQLDRLQVVVLVGLTLTTAMAIVIVPAARVLRTPISGGLKDGSGALGESPWLARWRSLLVVIQTMFAVVLLTGALLMIRTFQNLEKIDLGYDGTGRLKIQLGWPPTYPVNWEPRLAKLHEIQTVIARVPGVKSVGFSNDLMLQGYFVGTHTVESADGTPIKVMIGCLSRGFEEMSGIRLTRGRPLQLLRGNEILVSESLARVCWPGQDPVGKIMHPSGDAIGFDPNWKGWLVVGVVADMRPNLRSPPTLSFYADEGWDPQNYNTFIAKLAGPYDEALAGMIRRTLYAYDSQLVVNYIIALDHLRDGALAPEKFTNAVLQVLSGFAAFLTVVGLFSAVAYTVNSRKSEFGIRLALGAPRANLAGMVLRRGVLMAAVGLVLGLVSAIALTKFLGSLLYGTSPGDPLILASVSLVLLIASVLACAVPSYLATKVNITRLLRTE